MTSLTTETPAKYAVLMETNGEECESWLYFIKHDGNEDKLQHLLKQLEQIEMYIIDDLSTFDLDLEHLVSELRHMLWNIEVLVFFEESFFILLLLLFRMFCAATFQTNECAIIFPQSN